MFTTFIRDGVSKTLSCGSVASLILVSVMVRQKPGVCPQTVECWLPLRYHYTQQYQCFYDLECPGQYKCCVNSCYVHKVCLKPKFAVNPPASQSKDNDVINIDNEFDDEIISGSGNYEIIKNYNT